MGDAPLRSWVLAVPLLLAQPAAAQHLFAEAFESDLSGWRIVRPKWFEPVDSGDPTHGKVLKMSPGGGSHSYALIRGSENWAGIKVEGDVLFPDASDSYMGLVYNYTEHEGRVDYSNIYIKGNGSYLQANPRLDGNPTWAMLPEFQVPLKGSSAITIGKWQHFKAEIIGSMCHFYVGDMQTPGLTFDYPRLARGLVGFEPRVAGFPVWIDNIVVRAISRFSYGAPLRPDPSYEPQQLITDWDVIGPFAGNIPELEADSFLPHKSYTEAGRSYAWRKLATDRRGAVLTSPFLEFVGPRNRAYLHTVLRAGEAEEAELRFSSTEELLIWMNGDFWGYLKPVNSAWYDFWKNPEHAGPRQTVAVRLRPGDNHLLIMVNGGGYAGAGFFLRREPRPAGR